MLRGNKGRLDEAREVRRDNTTVKELRDLATTMSIHDLQCAATRL